MHYDNPNTLPPAVIRAFTQVTQEDCANNDYANLPQPKAPDMGGYAFFTSGTSGTSINYQVTFIPREGPMPEAEIERAHIAHMMEIKSELRGTQAI